MSITLPIVGILLAVFATFLARRAREASDRKSDYQPLVVAAVLVGAGAALSLKFAPESDRTPILMGLLIGAIAPLIGSMATSSSAAKVAWGVAFGAMVHLLPDQTGSAMPAAAIAAAGVVSALAGCSMTALALTAVVLADRIGALGSASAMMPMAGSVFGVALALSAVVTEIDRKNVALRMVGAIGLPLAFGYFVAGIWLKEPSLASAVTLGVAAGAILNFLVPNEDAPSSLAVGVGSVISVSLATVAFALAQGTGMAFALLGSLGVLGLLGNRRATLTLGPLFGLVIFRIFRTIYPETARSFDIGQHYALIGLLLGGMLPLLVVDWKAKQEKTIPFSVAAMLWGLIVLIATPVLMVFLGAYGTVGLLIGAGLAGVMEAVRNGTSTKAISLGTGIGGIVLLTYGWMTSAIDLTRDEKVRVLVWAVLGIGLLVGGIVALSRSVESEKGV